MLVDKNVARFANGGGLADNGGWFPTENPSLMNWSWKDFNRKTYDPNTPAGGPPEPSGWRMWLGNVDAGIFLKLKGDSVAWNEASPRAGSRGFEPPLSWAGQDGSSGSLNVSSSASSISPSSSSIRVEARSGPIQVLSGDGLRFNFTLMATPTKGDWTHTAEGKRGHYLYSRHYHVPYGDWNPTLPCDLKKTFLPGLTTYILHQSNKYNPSDEVGRFIKISKIGSSSSIGSDEITSSLHPIKVIIKTISVSLFIDSIMTEIYDGWRNVI
jgi:hypothetical protein